MFIFHIKGIIGTIISKNNNSVNKYLDMLIEKFRRSKVTSTYVEKLVKLIISQFIVCFLIYNISFTLYFYIRQN